MFWAFEYVKIVKGMRGCVMDVDLKITDPIIYIYTCVCVQVAGVWYLLNDFKKLM